MQRADADAGSRADAVRHAACLYGTVGFRYKQG